MIVANVIADVDALIGSRVSMPLGQMKAARAGLAREIAQLEERQATARAYPFRDRRDISKQLIRLGEQVAAMDREIAAAAAR